MKSEKHRSTAEVIIRVKLERANVYWLKRVSLKVFLVAKHLDLRTFRLQCRSYCDPLMMLSKDHSPKTYLELFSIPRLNVKGAPASFYSAEVCGRSVMRTTAGHLAQVSLHTFTSIRL